MRRILATVVALGVLLGAAAGLPGAEARAQSHLAQAQLVQTTAALPAPPPRPAVVDARLGVHPDKTRFVLEVSEAVPFRISTAAGPYRVIVELPDLLWPGSGVPVQGRGLVQRYLRMPAETGGLRLVLETKGPVRVREAFMLPPQDGRRPRFVMDLARSTADAFA